jgi:aminomethyltransferase
VPETLVAGARALVSRTGYTGEDGFEIYTDASDAVRVWNALLDAGRADSLVPVGLGARDTLRFESALPLYGHELGDTISPLEANLGFFVKFDKGDFIGRAALLSQKESGIPRELIGLEMIDRGIARNGCEVMANGAVIGFVTTGSFSPTLKKNIALALVTRGIIKEGDELRVIVRDKPLTAKRVTLPFYKKRYRR